MKMHKASKRLALLALGLSLAVSGRANFNPIPLTTDSFNADVVVESTATPKLQIVTTASVDQGTNNGAATWMEAGFDRANPGRGLPVAGSTFVAISNANYSFQMAPDYTAPNGILIDSVVTNGTFTLTTPAAYTLLSFVTSGGNGGHQIGVRVHHQDGSTEEGTITSPDWFGGSVNVAYIAGGRVDTTRNFNIQDNGANPRLYFRDVVLTNTTSPVTSVELYYISGTGNAHSDVVAMSGATTEGGSVSPIAVTGYTYDFIIEKEAPARQRIVSTTMVDGTNVWATTQTIENQSNTSWTFYEQGYNLDNPAGNGFAPNPAALNTGLPAAGSNVTNALGDHIFTLPPSYTENNAAYLTTVISNRTITFATPTTASVLSFLCTAGGGAATLDVVVNYQSGSSQTNVIVVPDWFNTGANAVVKPDGRVSVDNADFSGATLNANGNMQPWLNSVDLLVDESSPVTSIDITHRETGGQVGIFAVSGTTDAVLPVFASQPQGVKGNIGDSIEFSAHAVANVPISYQWQKGVNGVFTDVVNGGSVSGANTTNLTINPIAEIDDATYRVIASNTAGSATSAVATLIVLSPLADVTLPGDSVAAYAPDTTRGFPGGEAPPMAIDDTTSKYLHFGNNPISRLGFTVIPSQGRTIVSAMRLYAANDAEARDPVFVILEGSNDGGVSYSVIYSNTVSLPGGRNDGGLGLDPLNQNIAQVRFDNTTSYTSYRWYTTQLKGNVDLMQIGEVELLGVVDTTDPAPFFVTQPTPVTVYDEGFASFFVFANGTPSPNYQWQKGNNGVYTDLVDGGNISGAQSSFLSVGPVDFSDAGDYICIANNTSGSATSLVARLTVVSTNVDVTMPGDPIVIDYEDTAAAVNFYGDNGNPIQAIDDFNTLVYINAGSSISGGAGFPPFQGPAGVVVTPSAGFTRVVGLRIYTSTEETVRDPADYILEGSNNGGASYTVLSQGALDLPLARADNAQAFDPTVQPMQEILFANSTSYASYRLTFNNARDNQAADAIEIGEFELLGVVTGEPNPVLSITPDGSGGFNIESTGAGGNVYSTTNLSGTVIWNLEGTTPLNVAPNPAEPQKYFQIQP